MNIPDFLQSGAIVIASLVGERKLSATQTVSAALSVIEALDPTINAFTCVLREKALADAASLDKRIAAGEDPGPLAGVPFAVKNLFDIEGTTTLAGSKIHAGHAPATIDSNLVQRLKNARAI